jgi:hypothetical protein
VSAAVEIVNLAVRCRAQSIGLRFQTNLLLERYLRGFGTAKDLLGLRELRELKESAQFLESVGELKVEGIRESRFRSPFHSQLCN